MSDLAHLKGLTVGDLIAFLTDQPSDALVLIRTGASEHPAVIVEVGEEFADEVYALETEDQWVGDVPLGVKMLPEGVYPTLAAVEVPYLVEHDLDELHDHLDGGE